MIAESSIERREHPQAIKDLESAIRKVGQQQVIEQVAYTWFNRFTALRFMDANGYTQVRIVSPADGATRPELLAEAAAGNLPDEAPGRILALLDGRIPSNDGQSEAYRMLLVHECNRLHGALPFMFEAIDDYSELLMPDDLLSTSSILTETRAVMTEDACQDVEIIGWLYQFYISEKKDQVFAGLKKNQKITAENIPAATQLFTPHWIVRYLVENSLGRLWLLNNPQSGLAAKMDYYIAPEEPETDFLKITKPEEIRICDPAAGSGHMLTYAFDLLYAIYEEEGYDPTEIPALILEHNLTGVEIDDRAGALAAFALAMKAAARLGRRRFLRMEAKPDICVLQNVAFTEAEMQDVAAVVGKDLFTDELRETLGQFEQAKNFGSLIVPKLSDPAETLRVVEARDFGGDLLLKEVQARVIAVLRMAEALSPKYHVVVANPPYMGGKGMNGKLGDYAKSEYPDSKSDLFAMFIERSLRLAVRRGFLGFLTMQSWMFLGSYSKIRENILDKNRLVQMFHTGPGLFPELGSFNVLTTAFIVSAGANPDRNYCVFIKANETPDIQDKIEKIKKLKDHIRLNLLDLMGVPERPIVYWLNKSALKSFSDRTLIQEYCPPRQGMATSDNGRFVRAWTEVNIHDVGLNYTRASYASDSGKKWFPYNKGGNYQKWYGNNNDVVDWYGDGKAIKNFKDSSGKVRSAVRNEEFYFQEGIVYSLFGFENFGVRYKGNGFLFDVSGSSMFPDDVETTLAYLCSNVSFYFLRALAPTVNFQVGDLARLPLPKLPSPTHVRVKDLAKDCIEIVKEDWDSAETSWDFQMSPLLAHQGKTLETTTEFYLDTRGRKRGRLRKNEEEINHIMIDHFCLEGAVSREVLDRDLSYALSSNENAIKDFLSFAVGCMFGRYSLDAPGLILANQRETLADYLERVPEPKFMPDEDNVIPVLDADWFPDDITERFRLFLRTTFGEAHFRENLRYIEDALGKDIRKYFTKDFYTDHVKRYKKRPIYWMLSSPKGSFNALIYMHRYRSDTVSVVLNDYLREFISKLEAERARLEKLADDATATQGQRTKALKDAASVAKQIDELTDWERDVVFPLAQQKIEIDLDDGVKANYPKFGPALKKIPGLS
ncbi:BREX-1 system adenine-specific DNA-methyltransferase PglX [Pseudopelagicola sp. nBUS_20]|uniref:BREX-1 system adenine-specific DNA-methyltransferase PglX n=1 Tax=Pseudopelagicola sp. nBUS_20 TaxID=3395317 RepID=UPI003EBB1799